MPFTRSRYHGPQRSGRAMIPLTNPHTWAKRTFILFLSLLVVALTGCAGSESGTPSAGTGSGSSGRSPSAVATATTSTTTSSPSAAPSGPAELPVLHEGPARAISPGTYVTTKPDGFLPGLTLTIPAGWSATEADSGEIALHPDNRPDDAILLWKDMVVVVTNNRSDKVGQPLKGVGSTADALVKWLTTTSDFAILAKPKTVTFGDGVKGKQLTLTTSNIGDCPDNPHCARFSKTQTIGVATSMRSEAPRSHGSSSRRCTTRKATTRSLSRSMRSVLATLQRLPARHSRSSTASACPRSISGPDGHPKAIVVMAKLCPLRGSGSAYESRAAGYERGIVSTGRSTRRWRAPEAVLQRTNSRHALRR